MFTDWTMDDPKYFYVRGLITGCVLCVFLLPILIKLLRK